MSCTGRGPRRIVPPLSSMSRCSGMRSITGCVGEHVELGGVGVRSSPEDVAGELDDRALQPEAQPEVGDAVRRGRSGRPGSCPRCRDRRSRPGPRCRRRPSRRSALSAAQLLGVDPADLDVDAVSRAGVAERLGDAEVGVGQLDVLADDRDLEDSRLGALIRSTSSRHVVRSGAASGFRPSRSSRTISRRARAPRACSGTS